MLDIEKIELEEGSGFILLGSFLFTEKNINKEKLSGNFLSLPTRLEKNGISQEETTKHFREIYYLNYLQSSLPAFCKNNQISNIGKENVQLTKKLKGDEVVKLSFGDKFFKTYRIEFIDLSFFQTGIGIFCLKLCPQKRSLSDFVKGIHFFRDLTNNLSFEEESFNVRTFISKNILDFFEGDDNEVEDKILFNKLKAVNLVNISEQEKIEDKELFLYHVGSGSPIKEKTFSNSFTPAEKYFNRLKQSNYISIFDNWMGLSLMDSLSIISSSGISKNWDYDYLYIFAHQYYVKCYIFLMNKELALSNFGFRRTKQLRNSYIDFFNKNEFVEVSHNFLPNLIYDKVKVGLQIEKQTSSLSEKINNIHKVIEDYRSQILNNLLGILSLLSLIPAIFAIGSGSRKLLSLFGFVEAQQHNTELVVILSLATIGLLGLVYFMIWTIKRKRVPKPFKSP